MSEKGEREALVARTLAFVQSVAGNKHGYRAPQARPGAPPAKVELEPVVTIREFPSIRTPSLDTPSLDTPSFRPSSLQPSSLQPSGLQPSRPIAPSDLRTELRARIASFRAHQERFHRERGEYFNATLARMRAAIDEASPLRRDK